MLYGSRYEALRRALTKARKDASLTQIQLAQILGKGQSYVSKIENGEQYIDLIEFLAWCETCNAKEVEIINKIKAIK
ncbi:TPA: helix-turn-helix transcriptional regulator [Burkholderia vietnamiensis]|nr:helix-turn-helix transcriptional regulator [Burkholderia vietnamiensis]